MIPKPLKRIFLAIGVIFGSVILLNLAGKVFIAEIGQDIDLGRQVEAEVVPTIGKKAPYFDLRNLDGERVRLSDLSAAPAVLIFWNTWNSSAADQIKLADEYSEFNPSGVRVISINSQEDRQTANSFIERGGYGVEVLLDEQGAVTDLYEARNLPMIFFIDKNGRIVGKNIGILNPADLKDLSVRLFQ